MSYTDYDTDVLGYPVRITVDSDREDGVALWFNAPPAPIDERVGYLMPLGTDDMAGLNVAFHFLLDGTPVPEEYPPITE